MQILAACEHHEIFDEQRNAIDLPNDQLGRAARFRVGGSRGENFRGPTDSAEGIFNLVSDAGSDAPKRGKRFVLGDELLEVIDEREATILRLRYGLGGVETDPMTLKEIGKIVGLTRERVRQIEQEALRKLYGVMGEE